MELTGPENFHLDQEIELIDAIEHCFQYQQPKYQQVNNELVLAIGVCAKFSEIARKLVAAHYIRKGWRKVTQQESEGVTQLIFFF